MGEPFKKVTPPVSTVAPRNSPPSTAKKPKGSPRFKQISFYLSEDEYFALADESLARKRAGTEPNTHQGIAQEYLRSGLLKTKRL